MEVLALVGVSLASGSCVFFLLLRADRHRLDQAGAVFLLTFVAVGALSVLPGFALYALFGAFSFPAESGRWGQVLFIWTVNAPAEEIAKYLSFALVVALGRTIREPQDGALQGAATGLGFGLVENVLYGLSGGIPLLLLRSLVSLPGHVIYGAVWGGYHGFEVYQGRGRVRRYWVPLLALVPAVFAHALFNTLVLVDIPLLGVVVGDLLALGFGIFLTLQLRSYSPSLVRRPLKQWRQAIPETEHALSLNPGSIRLRQRLAAYYLAGDQAEKALAILDGLSDEPWTNFYRSAARRRGLASLGDPPPEASLNPKLFVRLSGG